ATPLALGTEAPVDEAKDAAEVERQAQLRGAERTQDFIERDYPLNNYDIRTVELHEIFPVLPRDGIRAIFEPNFDSIAEANEWLAYDEPVISVEFNGEARAYPLKILTWHEIVNDNVGGEPLIVTYCPLCNTAIVFKRTVDGEERTFGVSGALRRNDLIMYDRQTETLWQQITGTAIVGEPAGAQLDFVAAQIVSWRDFKTSFPDATVLNRDTGSFASYDQNPYPYYDQLGSATLFPLEDYDETTLDAKERVLTVNLGDDPIAFPFSVLTETVVLEAESAGQRVVAFWQPGASSPLDEAFIIAGRNVGAAGAFIPVADGQTLSFEARDGAIVDLQTGSTWNVLGKALDGPLAGTALEPVISANHFWFAWAVFEPETRVITG
ncbi:MAG: DUF3179 domain-containing protein, partial [Dehalococcoidia bacterium]|nr:DUF3179 domain-containing protein [Dehalococcoidia bacterium]